MRAVLDPNVLISALLSRRGTPARVLRAWVAGEFELIASPLLLAELGRALGYPKLRERIQKEEAEHFVAALARSAVVVADPASPPPVRSSDSGDDYLLALAASQQASLVSGDQHLLALRDAGFPIDSPGQFIKRLSR